MLRISKLTDYAIVVLASLASSPKGRMAAGELAELTGLPEPTVSKVLKLVSKQSWMESTRGVNGGYRLASTPDAINVKNIIAAIEGPVSLTSCTDENGKACDYHSKCSMNGCWDPINKAINDSLENVTLADLMKQKRAAS
ncbi:MAG: SUF system Fe-S cluster assembly regulator [Alphaproteobacteria bacterium]|nr:SUF system Fe-S cluster assembly regulator [Alphaproteobacteria bacterium]